MNTPLLQHITLIGKRSSVLADERLESIEKCSIHGFQIIEMQINKIKRDDRSFGLSTLYSLWIFSLPGFNPILDINCYR